MKIVVNGQRHVAQGFNWNALSAESPTTYSNTDNITINRKSFTNLNAGTQNGDNLVFTNCDNLIIRNCYFGSSVGIGIAITNCKNVLIEDCLFANNESAVYADSASEDIIIQDCQCINPHGPSPRGQFVQFNSVVTSVTGQCAIRRNRVENFLGESYPEDTINMFASSGRVGAPIDISDNIIKGGGPSLSGGAILTGDTSGSYTTFSNNWLVNPGQYGIAIAGGSNMVMDSNRIYSPSFDWNNIGAYIWAQGGATCSDATFTNNHVSYLDETGAINNFWDAGNCGTVTISGNVYNESFATMFPSFPSTLINMVTEDMLWQIRNESQQFSTVNWLDRPIANSEADKSVSSTSTTINSTGSSGGTTYNWVQVSGPNNVSNGLTLTNTTTATLSISGMIDGIYRFRLEYTDAVGASAADWTQVTKTP